MNTHIDLFLKNDDVFEANKHKIEEGAYVMLNIGEVSFYFEGFGQKGYEDACAYLDNMKEEIQNAWKTKGEYQ